MSTDHTDGRKAPRTPPERQRKIGRQSIAALERIGHTYVANRQREFLERLEAEEKGKQQ